MSPILARISNLVLVYLFFFIKTLAAQEPPRLSFELGSQEQRITLGIPFFSAKLQDSVRIEVCKFYLWPFNKLIDFEDSTSLFIPIQSIKKQHKLGLGIDSLTNATAQMIGDLDPTKGMYWTWQNGFIHIKIEGGIGCSHTSKRPFIYHIGGYQSPNNTFRLLSIDGLYEAQTLRIDADTFLAVMVQMPVFELMSPSSRAVIAAEAFRDCIHVTK